MMTRRLALVGVLLVWLCGASAWAGSYYFSFGSIFNNVVNPRFGGSGNGIMFF